MKKITDMMADRLVIDPSIKHENTIDDLIRQYKIDVISFNDNEEIILNLYYTLKRYFNEQVISEILESSISSEKIKELDRDYKLMTLGLK